MALEAQPEHGESSSAAQQFLGFQAVRGPSFSFKSHLPSLTSPGPWRHLSSSPETITELSTAHSHAASKEFSHGEDPEGRGSQVLWGNYLMFKFISILLY